MLLGEASGLAKRLVPLVSDLREGSVENGAESLDEFGERVGVVLIFAAAEAVFGHDDSAAELRGVAVAGGQLGTLRRGEERAYGGEALLVELSGYVWPVEGGDLLREVHA